MQDNVVAIPVFWRGFFSTTLYLSLLHTLYTMSQKHGIKLLFITFQDIDQFSNFFLLLDSAENLQLNSVNFLTRRFTAL